MTAIDLGTLHLAKGGHGSREQGVCLMEAVAWWRDIRHTDAPACVSPVLRATGVSLNDVLPDDLRQQLVPFVPLLPGTADDGRDERRGYLALDWLVRTYLPAWLDLVPSLAADAAAVRDLPVIDDLDWARLAGPVVQSARDHASAAWDAAWDAAGAAAWAAAGAAAGAVLASTVLTLQQSFIGVYGQMISGE
ncbi:MAG TPA: hypothetical protein VIX86_05510 [Streptosporangiaceae bacterium]